MCIPENHYYPSLGNISFEVLHLEKVPNPLTIIRSKRLTVHIEYNLQ